MVTSHMSITQKLANFVFPSPRSNGKSTDAIRTDLPPNEANNSETPSRCQFTFSDGRQCSSPAKVYPQDELSPVKEVQRAQFCIHHASNKRPSTGVVEPEKGVAITPLFGHEKVGLEALCGDLTTATNINRALSQVFLLMAQGRISQKQAVAFGYLSQLLLQTVPGIRSEYVSVHGYQAWQNNLKSKIIPLPHAPAAQTEPPDQTPSTVGGDAHGGANVVILSEQGERRISPNPLSEPAARPASSPQSTETKAIPPVPPSLDYASLYRRSLDLLDRKYDTTPEGLREANALMTELELLNPKPAAVMKKESQTPPVPSIPYVPATLKTALPELPSPPATTARPNERDVDFVAPACPEPRRVYPESCEATRRSCHDLSRASREPRRPSRRPESQFPPPRRKRQAPVVRGSEQPSTGVVEPKKPWASRRFFGVKKVTAPIGTRPPLGQGLGSIRFRVVRKN